MFFNNGVWYNHYSKRNVLKQATLGRIPLVFLRLGLQNIMCS